MRNHVAGPLDHHGIADPDIAAVAQLLAVAADALDVVLIVQRDVLHDDAADADRLQFADRRERAGAPDLDLDIAERSRGAFGREFMRNRPARRTRHEAEALLPVDPVDLVNDAVDIVVELGALLLDLAMERDQLIGGVTEFRQRVGLEAAALEPADHAGLGVFRHRAHLAPGIGEKPERPRGGDDRILLTQRTSRRIAGIGERSFSGIDLLLVEREKGLLGHVDFAADLADVGHIAALQLLRDVFERADIGGDVLAFRTVATGGGGDEFAALVAQRHRQPVDFRLGGKIDLVVLQLENPFDAADEIEHVLFSEGVVQRQHRHRVADFLEAPRGCRAYLLRRRVRGDEFREALFDGVVALPQRIVLARRPGSSACRDLPAPAPAACARPWPGPW